MPTDDPKNYRTESGHAPGEVTPDKIGVLHGVATKHKERKKPDGTYTYGSAEHAAAPGESAPTSQDGDA